MNRFADVTGAAAASGEKSIMTAAPAHRRQSFFAEARDPVPSEHNLDEMHDSSEAMLINSKVAKIVVMPSRIAVANVVVRLDRKVIATNTTVPIAESSRQFELRHRQAAKSELSKSAAAS